VIRYISLQIIIFFISIAAFAQEKSADTTDITMDEVVITSQYEPQSLKKSVHNVRIITKQDIEQQAAVNLGDLLNQYLNITVTPNNSKGRSTVSMFGLDGQYFKILIDNVPLVSDSGLGNDTDLTQINLADVEQIEIIEGSMGVTHGANAVTGILNIITKKSSEHKWEAYAMLQEETVGKEYALFDKGRHIQAFKISHNPNENWFVSLGANRNDFAGFYGDKEGKDHTVNDGRRGYTWLPEVQYSTNTMVTYNKNNLRLFYKFEFLNETISYYDYAVQTAFVPPASVIRYSNDERFISTRFYHHLNGTGTIFNNVNFNISASHQKQSRDYETFKYYLDSEQEIDKNSVTDQSMEVLYSTSTFSNLFKSDFLKLQLGYEFVNNNGFALVSGENQIPLAIRKRLENYDAFVSGELIFTDKFSLRPGFRYSFQSRFDNQYATSIGLRYLAGQGIELRTSSGRSYRTPNFEELYSRLIFSGHYFIGNEKLIPETSNSYEASIKKTTAFESGARMINNLMVSYLTVKDKIDMALTGFAEASSTPIYQYINISKYRMWNAALSNEYQKDNWHLRLGASLIGISQEIKNGEAVSDDKFLYSLQLNANLSYNVPKWNTLFAVYYKYNGRQQRFYESSDENGPVYKLSSIDPYSWLDASVKRSFFKKTFDIALGSRNILNIVNVQQTQNNAGAAHATSTDILLGYGRSYYLKLAYNLNF
jgi:outer membrane receptor for ferrienterochelin and colicins